MYGAMAGSVGGQTKHCSHRKQTAAMVSVLELDALEAAVFWLGQSVEIAEPGVGHRPVRIEQSLDGQILGEHLAEILHRLIAHARLQPIVVSRVDFFVGREHADAVQLQPLTGKVVDEAVHPIVRHHPVYLLLQASPSFRLPALAAAKRSHRRAWNSRGSTRAGRQAPESSKPFRGPSGSPSTR